MWRSIGHKFRKQFWIASRRAALAVPMTGNELFSASLSANSQAWETQAAQQPSDCAPDLPLAWIGGHGTVPYEQ